MGEAPAGTPYGIVYTRPVRSGEFLCLMPPDSNIQQGNPRTTAIRAVALMNNLHLEYKTVEGAAECGPEYLELNPLGKVPTFVRHDGFVLTECIAITTYCKSHSPAMTLAWLPD